ncbi:MAG: glycosyl transferase family 2 [Mucilaginibacter sp.]|nr:glycosyl transferase family 2 [Mucilaginibacter sp.]
MNKKVSICIPTYNQIHFLEKTLNSILIQSFKDFEIIITDDSSSSMVRDLVNKYDFGDKLKYYHNKPSLGSPKNWNFCISKATGDYIKIMHHDDWFTSERSLEVFINAIENTGADFVFSNAEVIYVKSNKKGSHSPGKSNLLKLKNDASVLFIENFIGDPSMIIYKRYPNMFFDEALKWLVDVDFYIMFLRKHPRFIHVNEPLLTISAEVENSVTSECLNREVELFENFYLFNKLNRNLSYRQMVRNTNHLLRLIQRYNISSIREVKSFGGYITFYLTIQVYIYKLKKNGKQMLRNVKNLLKN